MLTTAKNVNAICSSCNACRQLSERRIGKKRLKSDTQQSVVGVVIERIKQDFSTFIWFWIIPNRFIVINVLNNPCKAPDLIKSIGAGGFNV